MMIFISAIIAITINNKKVKRLNITQIDYYKEDTSQLQSQLKTLDKYYKVINIFKRENPTVYTQGLFYTNRSLYESGGLYGKSSVKQMKWPSQEIITNVKLEDKYFGEGIAASDTNKILYQLTWREREILLYSMPDLQFIKKIKLPYEIREGWGMTKGFNEDEFFITDGSDKIHTVKINSETNELFYVSSITVTLNDQTISQLNELTYDGVFIYSNVYFSKNVIKINPHNGNVLNVYNMTPLMNYNIENGNLTDMKVYNGDVLNGITYISERKSYILTGKLWDYYYEVIFM